MSKQSEYNCKLREYHKSQGLCTHCNLAVKTGKTMCQKHLNNAIKQRQKSEESKSKCTHITGVNARFCSLCGKRLKPNHDVMSTNHHVMSSQSPKTSNREPIRSSQITNHDIMSRLSNPVETETNPVSSDISTFLAKKGIQAQPIATPLETPKLPVQNYTRKATNHISFTPENDNSINLVTDD